MHVRAPVVMEDEYYALHDPANPNAQGNLSGIYSVAGRWDDAIAAARTALSLSPGIEGAHQTVGTALLMQGNASAAAVLEALFAGFAAHC